MICYPREVLDAMGVVRADAPWLRKIASDPDTNLQNPLRKTRRNPPVMDPLPPFGTNPPRRPIVESGAPLDERIISNDPRELWYLALPSKLTPSQVTTILRSAQGGDIWQQFQLCQLMLDTWPMLRKCDHEIREAVSSVRYFARPFCEEGQEPSEQAKKKADLVNRCWHQMQPSPFNDERGFRGMVYHMAGAFLMGLTMEELLWHPLTNYPGHGMENHLRAAVFVHPRHFTFSDSGTLALFDDAYHRLYFNMAKLGENPDPRRFVCGQFYSSSGSTLGAGFVRPLAKYWSSLIYGWEWLARAAENHGAPFVDVTYRPGMSQGDLDTLDNNVKKGLANRYIRHIEGSTLNVTNPASLGTDNPLRFLAEQADRQCQLLLLGQTLTSDTPAAGGGTRAQGEVHMTVLEARKEGVARWMAAEPLQQVAQAILLANYGPNGTDECPVIEADLRKPMSAQERIQYIAAIGNSPVPILAEDVYHDTGYVMPEEGDKVFIRGQMGILGDTEQDHLAGPEDQRRQQQEAMEQRIAQQGNDDGFEDVKAKLAKMTDAELDEFEMLVRAAEQAPKPNGEWDLVRTKLSERKPRKEDYAEICRR